MSTGRSLLGLALALAAAALYAGGIALQALEARAAPPERALRLALLRHLVRRPRWVAGTLAGLAGWALQATALLVAPLTLVQPALPAGLVLLLPLGKRALGEPVRRREAAAVLLVAGGLAALGWAAPARDPRHASGPTLVAALAGLGALALLPYAAPRRRSAALPLAAAAGLAYAWDGLATKFFTDDLSARGWPGAALWLAGMLVASGFGTLSEMSALQAGPATRVAPVVSALTTLAVVSLAPLLAREQVPAGPLARSALLAGLAAVVLGTAAIARAPAVTGVLARGRRKASREAERPAGRSDAARRRPRVLVLTAEEGRGHTSVAGTLAAELAEEGAEVVVHDALADSLGRVIPFFTRDAYRVQLRRLSWSYGLEYLLFTRLPPGRAVARAGLALLGSRPLLRLLRRTAPDVVVSTHPTLTAVLGSLRRRGLLHVPAVATISDFGVHPLWAHPGVDLHLVVHPSCLAAVERVAGRGSARVCRPIVARAFRRPPAQRAARAALGLPAEGTVVVVSGGGWGVGAIERLARAAVTLRDATVVCVAGENDALRRELERAAAGEPRLRVLGFTDEMPALLAAADVLVETGVGVTCLEALACGCPIVVAGTPPGHSRDNAHAIARVGLAEHARSPDALPAALRRVRAARASPALADGPSAASLILAAAPRPVPRPVLPRLVAATAGAALLFLSLGGFLLASPEPYPLVARVLGLEPLAAVATREPVVGLVVRVSAGQARQAARALAAAHVHASLALTDLARRRDATRLRHWTRSLLPAMEPLDLAHPLRTRSELERVVHACGLPHGFYFLLPAAPRVVLADSLAGQSLGGRPLAGTFLRPRQALPRALRPGAIIVLSLPRSADVRASIVELVRDLRSRGLRPVSLSELLAARRTPAGTSE